jgi:two-component system, NarL family, nitrate/nitrite response regulator NarL
MIKIGLVDDHQIVIDGLTALLKEKVEIQIVCTANNGKAMLELLNLYDIDILLTDMMMPEMNGLELAVQVKKLHPTIKIIALSMNGEGLLVNEMIDQADIAGYLLKQTDVGELVFAIKKVFDGGIYFQEVVLNALTNYSNLKKEVETTHLTLREREVISWMERDYSNKQIADELNIAVRTVETHRKNIFRKTGTNNLLSLVKWAYEHKIL